MATLKEAKAKGSDMSPALRREFERLKKLSRDSEKALAAANYSIGETLAKVREDTQTYGANPVNTLAKALGLHRSTIADSQRVVATWDADAFRDVWSRSVPFGAKRGLTWSHFVELASILDTTRRDELMDKCMSQGMSVRDLRQAIKTDACDAVGAKVKPAETKDRKLVAIASAAQAMLSQAKCCLSRLQEVDLDTVDRTPTTTDLLNATLETTETTIDIIAQITATAGELMFAAMLANPRNKESRNAS